MNFLLPRIYRRMFWEATESLCKVRRLGSPHDVGPERRVLEGTCQSTAHWIPPEPTCGGFFGGSCPDMVLYLGAWVVVGVAQIVMTGRSCLYWKQQQVF